MSPFEWFFIGSIVGFIAGALLISKKSEEEAQPTQTADVNALLMNQFSALQVQNMIRDSQLQARRQEVEYLELQTRQTEMFNHTKRNDLDKKQMMLRSLLSQLSDQLGVDATPNGNFREVSQ